MENLVTLEGERDSLTMDVEVLRQRLVLMELGAHEPLSESKQELENQVQGLRAEKVALTQRVVSLQRQRLRVA